MDTNCQVDEPTLINSTCPRYSFFADCPFLNSFNVGYFVMWNID